MCVEVRNGGGRKGGELDLLLLVNLSTVKCPRSCLSPRDEDTGRYKIYNVG